MDIASKKQLVIVVHFYCDRELKVRSCFFKLVEVTHCDADSIILNSFEKSKVPTDNIIDHLIQQCDVWTTPLCCYMLEGENSTLVCDEVYLSLCSPVCFTCL